MTKEVPNVGLGWVRTQFTEIFEQHNEERGEPERDHMPTTEERKMREHSPGAWRIASLYSKYLASETRDLAAHIDMAIARERERCAKIAEDLSTKPGWSPGYKGAAEVIAKAIRQPS